MKKNKKGGIWYFLSGVATTLIVILVLFLVSNKDYFFKGVTVPTQIGAQNKIETIYNLIGRTFLGKADPDRLSESMYAGLVDGLDDKYSTYYTKEEYEKLKQSIEGHYTGIGITVGEDNGRFVIGKVLTGTPAEKAGIKDGDVMTAIDDESLDGLSTQDVVNIIGKHKVGDTLVIAIERGGEKLELAVKVEEVESVSVTSEMKDGHIGYIAISEFTSLTSNQFKSAYQTLEDEGMERLIIDLRNNPGGLMTGVCNTLRQILPEGLIVYTEDKNGERQEEKSKGETPIDIPLVLLVNENSASAAEIFAGAVKDYGIGTIIGTTTFGKGIVQDTYELQDGSAVKITVSEYFTPKGNEIHKKGVTPDIEVEQPEDSDKDVQLERALSEVKS